MYKVTRRSNLIQVLVVLAIGIGISIYLPEVFRDTRGEIPAFALFPGEIAIALILAVLLYENAAPAKLIEISGYMLFITFLTGAICNMVGGHTVWMPDSTLQLNWAQLLAFNAVGLFGIMSLYETVPVDEFERRATGVKPQPQETGADAPAPSKIDFSPQEQAQEVLNQLDQGRIENLEQSISPDKVSLESLFAEETQAAGAKKEVKAAQSVQKDTDILPEPVKEEAPVIEAVKLEVQEEIKVEIKEEVKVEVAPEPPKKEAAPAQGGLLGDVSSDIEDIFSDLAGDASSKDFAAQEKKDEPAKQEAAPEAPAVAAESPAEAAEPAGSSLGPKVGDAAAAEKAVKEIGKLAASGSAAQPEVAGTLKTIGQMLLDTRAVERIIKESSEKQEGGTKWRVLTVDRGADLQALMDKIGEFAGVESALLMGKDGLLLSNTESVSAQKYVYGPLSLAMHSTTNLGTSKLQMGDLRQAILRCDDKISILTDVGSAILAVFSAWDLPNIDKLMNHINQAVAGSSVGAELPDDMQPDLSAEPEQAAPAAEPQAPEPAVSAAAEGKLMNVSDQEVGDLFDNLMADKPAEAEKKSMDFSPAEEKQEEKPEEKKEEPAEAPAKTEESEKEAEAAKAAPESKDKKKDKKKDGKSPEHIKEFGKLSAQAAKQDTGGGEGAMKAIGRQLIDVQAVENIIKSGEKREKIGSGLTTARVISAARGEGIKALLSRIDGYEGVIGSLIVGHDGMVIASTLQGGVDKDVMGALCTAIHSHLDVAVKKLEKGKLQQCVFVGEGDKLTVMTGVAVGILAVFVDNSGIDRVDGLLNAIESTVRG